MQCAISDQCFQEEGGEEGVVRVVVGGEYFVVVSRRDDDETTAVSVRGTSMRHARCRPASTAAQYCRAQYCPKF